MNKKILGVILGIIITGSILTRLTNEYIVTQIPSAGDVTPDVFLLESQPEVEDASKSVVISPLETITPARGETFISPKNDRAFVHEDISDSETSAYERRLSDLDTQIARMKEEDSGNTYKMKNIVETELKLWEGERNTVYTTIIEQLNAVDSKDFIQQEKEWIKERDQVVSEITGKNTVIENLEYTTTISSLTRQHVYDLVEQYQSILSD